jgi:hypothetical protein
MASVAAIPRAEIGLRAGGVTILAAQRLLRKGSRRVIVKAVHRVTTCAGEARSPAGYAIHHTPTAIAGKVVERATTKPASDPICCSMGWTGALHNARPRILDLDDLPIHAILAVEPASLRPSDRTITELARTNAGIYAPEHRRDHLSVTGAPDPDGIVEAHVQGWR